MAKAFNTKHGGGGRILGMLTVQVERDPKTGATVVKSVAPTSTPDSRPPASAVFDDGRKSIHAVGGSGCNPSTEELGQILSAVDGVGMQVMLDEVTVTLDEAADAGASGGPFKQIQAPVNQSAAKENRMQVSRLSVRGEEDANATVVRDTAGKEVTMEDHVLEESPITLLFLGYADSTTAQENPDMLVAERVMIADDGEEPRVADREAGEKSESEMDQGIPQKGKDQTSQVREDHANQEPSCPPTVEERKGPSKHKTCHCCSVM
uniref:Paralemmin n=1 Tax=Hippocampus comes TaxID=109280 RepID=A0A3Q3DMP4_HIPCM